MSKLYNLNQAAKHLNVSYKTLTRYIKKNLLCPIPVQDKGRTVKKFTEEELERFLKLQQDTYRTGIGQDMSETHIGHIQDKINIDNDFNNRTDIGQEQDTNRTGIGQQAIKDLLKEVIIEQQSQLMKPLEEQALYIAGSLTKENQFLKYQMETLLSENTKYQDENKKLQEQLKLLPGPVEEITSKMQQLQEEKEKTTVALNEEKTTRSRIETEVTQLKEKINILPAPPEVIVKTLKEKEEAIVKAEAKSQELGQKIKEEKLQAEEQSELFKQEKRGLKDRIDTIKKEKDKHLKINIVTAVIIVLLIVVSSVIIPKLNGTISKTTEQLHMMQATKSAIEASKEEKEKLLNKTNEAWQLYSSKKYDEAIKIYDDILQTDPNNLIAWDNKGQALYELKTYNEAIICFDKLLQLNPDAVQSLYIKGQALYQLKKYKEAVTCFDNYLNVDPRQVNVWNYKGKALDKIGQYNEAIKCYNKTLSIDPNNIEATVLLNTMR